jgi:hypothetical protein
MLLPHWHIPDLSQGTSVSIEHNLSTTYNFTLAVTACPLPMLTKYWSFPGCSFEKSEVLFATTTAQSYITATQEPSTPHCEMLLHAIPFVH